MGSRKGTFASPRRSHSPAIAVPTTASRQVISRVARWHAVGLKSTKLSCLKQVRPCGTSPVPGETGGTGATVRMYFKLPLAIRLRSLSGRGSRSGTKAGGDRKSVVYGKSVDLGGRRII